MCSAKFCQAGCAQELFQPFLAGSDYSLWILFIFDTKYSFWHWIFISDTKYSFFTLNIHFDTRIGLTSHECSLNLREQMDNLKLSLTKADLLVWRLLEAWVANTLVGAVHIDTLTIRTHSIVSALIHIWKFSKQIGNVKTISYPLNYPVSSLDIFSPHLDKGHVF